jgi:hypothetical protein
MTQQLEGLVQRSVRLALPKTEQALRQFLLGALRLEHVTALEVTPTSVSVERFVEPEGEVLTPALKATHAGTSLEPDLDTLLQLLHLEALTIEPGAHVLHLMMRLYEMVLEAGVQPVALYARQGDDLAAALGLPASSAGPATLFGVQVVYVDSGLEEGSILLVGSPSPFLADATYGVVADIGGVT